MDLIPDIKWFETRTKIINVVDRPLFYVTCFSFVKSFLIFLCCFVCHPFLVSSFRTVSKRTRCSCDILQSTRRRVVQRNFPISCQLASEKSGRSEHSSIFSSKSCRASHSSRCSCRCLALSAALPACPSTTSRYSPYYCTTCTCS